MATSVSSMTSLEKRILELEKLQDQQMAEFKMSAMSMMESFSPSNMIRTALRDVVQSPDIRSAAINTAIGMGAGLLGRKLVVGNSGNMFKKITGTAVQFLVANFVRKKIPEMQKKTSGM
ncbi:MAG: hypothetical protein E6H07_17600 [Bacteroidetes bacterium]|nr:MAG: hypothetical protein E6H07_17600 [Bacteroidota bacterium]